MDAKQEYQLGFKHDTPGAWRVPSIFQLTEHASLEDPVLLLQDLAFFIPDALSPVDCQLLSNLFAQQAKKPVSISGHATADVSAIGSQRATGWGPELGNQLWKKIATQVSKLLRAFDYMEDFTATDWYGTSVRKEHRNWKPVGISPVLRFMEYASGGKHNTHYDQGYDYEANDPKDRRRTLLSVVWYLNQEPNGTGGHTRFILDGQQDLPVFQRNLEDWIREAREEEVIASQAPKQGGALLFWHRMPHDVETFTGNSRIIIRGDVEFWALGDASHQIGI